MSFLYHLSDLMTCFIKYGGITLMLPFLAFSIPILTIKIIKMPFEGVSKRD